MQVFRPRRSTCHRPPRRHNEEKLTPEERGLKHFKQILVHCPPVVDVIKLYLEEI